MKARKIAFLGMMLALMVVLSMAETMFLALPPHFKPGLANVVVMYVVFSVGKKEAVTLNILKSLFVLIIRGGTAGLLSFCGGMFSIAIIILLAHRKNPQFSYVFISICGACMFNIGQLTAASFLLNFDGIFYFLPIFLLVSIVTGGVCGVLVNYTPPTGWRL